jgi:hypothetical protein
VTIVRGYERIAARCGKTELVWVRAQIARIEVARVEFENRYL